MGQIALSHAPQTMLAKNYTSTRDFTRFNDLQRQMHAELVAAGMFERVPAKQKHERKAVAA